MMNLSHRIALDPTDKQREYFAKACGCARFVWNLALDEWDRRYRETGKRPSWMEMQKDFNAIKYEAFPWMKDIARDAHARPFRNLNDAFIQFFRKIGRHPKHHKKGYRDSFYVANDQFLINENSVRLPLVGCVRMTEALRLAGKIISATVSRTADRWFIAFQVEVADESAKRTRTADGVVGVDVGINSAATLSTGEKIDAPKPLSKALKKLKRMQRKQHRQAIGGKNRQKQNDRIAKIHSRIANVRYDFWHKLTTRLCRENQAIAIENLNVVGMLKNKNISRHLKDVGFGAMKPMLEYKSKIYGNEIIKVDQWFPSSRTCSECGSKKESLSLGERIFRCNRCGFKCDRDVNAAINLKNQIPTACGELMPADWERLVKAPCEAGTTMLVDHPVGCVDCDLKESSGRAISVFKLRMRR